MDEKSIIEEREKNILNFFRDKQVWVFAILIVLLIIGVYLRSLPMTDHGGKPGLWDITTNTWTLGPDLDPWLFERYAKIIVENNGVLPKDDLMRNVPLGFNTYTETRILPYMISYTYYIINFFSSTNIEFASAVFPVIMFGLTIILFFLFVREIFSRETKGSKIKANIIALISTLFMIVIPEFLSRTVAGIPEKESAGFFFMFLAFYLFLKAWKTKKSYISYLLGALSGIATALMGLIWGGVIYVFVTIAVSTFIAFILNKINKKEFINYSLWVLLSFGTMLIFSERFDLMGFITSLDSGLAFLVFFILAVDILIWKTSIHKIRVIEKIKLPKTIVSIILSIILIIIIISVIFGPIFFINKLNDLNRILFNPVTGRWGTTVAENRQPYFTEWGGSFGPFINNIPITFWLFFLGSVVLFKKMLSKMHKKHAWILTLLYILFFFGLVFSRYAAHPSLFDGENFISKAIYYVSALLLAGTFIYYFIQYYKKDDKSLEEIEFETLLLLVLLALCLFTARSAVRLIMVLAPIAPIFISYLIVELFSDMRKAKDETWKVVLGAVLILILCLSIYSINIFYKDTKNRSYNFVPSYYNQQWQLAMDWVRNNTAQNAVFGHWWDYGYWVQSIGNRATVLDGGNSITYWNYLMGRLVLTGDNQDQALEFLYNHNTTHFLIDSSDIGKYGAFASIGSDENYDRYSWIGTLTQDETQTQETNNQTYYVYKSGGIATDEDMIIKDSSGKEILIPGKAAAVGFIILPMINNNNSVSFSQPSVVFFYNGNQYKQDLRYLSINNQFFDFKSGIEGCAFIMPRIDRGTGNGVSSNKIGAAMYLSPRLMKSFLVQKYILNDPFNKFPNFKIIYTEPNMIVDSFNKQGMDLPDLVYFEGIQGPIKIWEIQYTGKEKVNQEYLDTDPNKYLKWRL